MFNFNGGRVLSFIVIISCSIAIGRSIPLLDASAKLEADSEAEAKPSDTLVEESNALASNDTPKNLYVVKAVVYEIGILTEVGENDTSIESLERVDLSFFDAHTNQSHIDLGTVPLPIQTNVTGQVLTGIAPVNIGAFSSPAELLNTLPLTGSIVNITHSDTAYYQLKKSTSKNSYESPSFIQDFQLSNLADIANLFGSNHTHTSPPAAHADSQTSTSSSNLNTKSVAANS